MNDPYIRGLHHGFCATIDLLLFATMYYSLNAYLAEDKYMAFGVAAIYIFSVNCRRLEHAFKNKTEVT